VTVEDYKRRDAHIVKYIKHQISSINPASFSSTGKRSAYKDILFKLTGSSDEAVSQEEVDSYYDIMGRFRKAIKEIYEDYINGMEYPPSLQDYVYLKITGGL